MSMVKVNMQDSRAIEMSATPKSWKNSRENPLALEMCVMPKSQQTSRENP